MSLSPEDTYRELMYELQQGCALYEPDPCGGYDHVRVGDVGYLLSGVFIRLFNVCYDASDNANKDEDGNQSVPCNFHPLPHRARAFMQRNPLEAGPRTSSSVRQIGVETGVSFGAIVSPGVQLSFECETQRGAALITKHTADRYDATRPQEFRLHMGKYYRKWLEFANVELGCSIKLDDLILVTGCDLTREWATVALSETKRGGKVALQFNVAAAGAAASLWGRWTLTTQVPPRVGPSGRLQPSVVGRPDDDKYDAGETLSLSGSSPLHTEGSSTSSQSPITSPTPRSQCIFMRGWRAQRRPVVDPILKLKLKAAAEPEDPTKERTPPPSSSSVDAGSSESDGCASIMDLSLHETPQSPMVYDIFFNFMFRKSDADLVFLHEDDIGRIVSAKIQAGFDSLEEYLECHADSHKISTEASDATGALDIAETDSATIEVRNLTFAPALSKLIGVLLDTTANPHITELPQATTANGHTFRVTYATHDDARRAYIKLKDCVATAHSQNPPVEVLRPQPLIEGFFSDAELCDLVGGQPMPSSSNPLPSTSSPIDEDVPDVFRSPLYAPPTSTPVHESPAMTSNKRKANEAIYHGESSAVSPGLVARRGPGRPRKNSAVPAPRAPIVGPHEEPAKRKRGRPPRPSTAEELAAMAAKAAMPKRPRGRPRRVRPEDAAQAQAQQLQSSAAASTSVMAADASTSGGPSTAGLSSATYTESP